MNNAKMWLVVPPAVGVPVFLGAVAVGSFAVHVAVLSNTSWVSDFLSGQPLGSGDMAAAATMIEAPAVDTAKAAYIVPNSNGDEITIIMSDGTTAQAVLTRTDVLASADVLPRTVSD
jgi:light-harvesting protein B-800-850 alpha chain